MAQTGDVQSSYPASSTPTHGGKPPSTRPAPAWAVLEKPDLKAWRILVRNMLSVKAMCAAPAPWRPRSQMPNSANSQFFICFTDAPWLNKQYSVWGQVIEGMENIDKIKRGEPVRDPDDNRLDEGLGNADIGAWA
jgi:peptidyl-prolyl cis-trans isomerase B (cyclophilin B)